MRPVLFCLALLFSCSSSEKGTDLRKDSSHIAALVKDTPQPNYVFEVKEDGTIMPVQTYLKENLKTWVTYKPGTWEISETKDKDVPEAKYVVKHSYSVNDEQGRPQAITTGFFLDATGKVLKAFPADENVKTP